MNGIQTEEKFDCMEKIEQKYARDEEQESHRFPPPTSNTPFFLLITTMILTSCATGLTCLSLLTNHWEYISWNIQQINKIAIQTEKLVNDPLFVSFEPLLDEVVIKLSIYDTDYKDKIEMTNRSPQTGKNATMTMYLVPMNGGVWTLCVFLNDQQLNLLEKINFPKEICINYFSTSLFKDEEHLSSNWNYRMKNISISCAVVCLILLGSAALVGAFGILKHQLSAILVTGVMYLLAGTFALFTVLILHLKKLDYLRNQQSYETSGVMNISTSYIVDEGIVQQTTNSVNSQFSKIWNDYYPAREFSVGWSFDVGIVSVVLSMITSVMWIIMAKMLRYTTVAVSV